MGGKTSPKRPQFSRLIAVGAASISVVFLLAFGSQIVEIYRLRNSMGVAETGLEALRAEQESLQATLTYVQSDDYVERIARAELNKVQPGDQRVVVITRVAPAVTPAPTPLPQAPLGRSSYFGTWWELLFGD